MPVPETDRTVADAIDRVLEAEQAAAAAIGRAEAAGRAAIEAAREERRRILERARARIMRLHDRAATQLAARLAQLDMTLAAEAQASSLPPDGMPAVLATVAERLTSESLQ
jgi:F0F1-type ATP synthase membrane subunit b/b'